MNHLSASHLDWYVRPVERVTLLNRNIVFNAQQLRTGIALMGGLFSISRRVYVKSAARCNKKVFYADMPNGSFTFSRLKVYVELALDYAALK